MTIINPDGAIEIIFRSDELSVSSVAAAGSDETDATLCTVHSTRTVLQVDSDSNSKGIRLQGGEVGDQIQLFRADGGSDFKVYRPDGALLLNWTSPATAILLPDGWGWFN